MGLLVGVRDQRSACRKFRFTLAKSRADLHQFFEHPGQRGGHGPGRIAACRVAACRFAASSGVPASETIGPSLKCPRVVPMPGLTETEQSRSVGVLGSGPTNIEATNR